MRNQGEKDRLRREGVLISSLLENSVRSKLGATAGLYSSVFREKRSTAIASQSGTRLFQRAVRDDYFSKISHLDVPETVPGSQ